MGIPLNPPAVLTPPAGDQANAVLSGQFSAPGVSKAFPCYGAFNVVAYGSGGPNGSWTGSVQLERSFDGGTTWIVASVAGAQAVYATGKDVSLMVTEIEKGVAYRWDCTALSVGTLNYRFSTNGLNAMSQGVGPG